MRNTLTLALCVIALLVGSAGAFAQGDTDCLATLSQAEDEFAAGRFIGIPDLLKDCLDRNRFSNEEKVRVYSLLTQVYLLTDNPNEADQSYLRLLGANPEYVPTDLDPIEVVYLSKKFTSTPIFTPHVKAGGNLSSQAVIYPQNVISTPDSTSINQTPLVGFSLGGGVEWNINDNVGVGGEVFLSQKNFRSKIENIFTHDSQQTTERQLWIDIPIYLRYGRNRGNIRPFAYAGASINLLVGSRVEAVFNDKTEGTGTESDKVTTSASRPYSVMYKRDLFNRALVFGGGAKFKLGKDFVIVDVRYMPGLTNVTNLKANNYETKERFDLATPTTQFGSIGDIFRVNNFSLSVGYVKPLYNPRKANRVKTKSVSRKLIRDDK